MSESDIYASYLDLARQDGELIWFGGINNKFHYPDTDQPVEGWLCIPRHVWKLMGKPKKILTAISAEDFLARDTDASKYLYSLTPSFLKAVLDE